MNDAFAKTLMEAPQEVRDATAKANRAFRRLLRAEKQCQLWTNEFKIAQHEHAAASAEQVEILNRWDGRSATLGPDPKETAQESTS